MLLCIDVGNTQTVYGIFAGDRLERSWRTKTDSRATADELALTVRGLLDGEQVSGLAVCSTVPAVLRELRAMIAGYYGELPAVVVGPGVRTGVPLTVDNPQRGRCGPGGQQPRGVPPVRGSGDRRRLRHVDEP